MVNFVLYIKIDKCSPKDMVQGQEFGVVEGD